MERDRTAPGSREQRKRRTHEELLRAGLDLFLTRGYARTTVGDIARSARVSERTFFRYFASKEELILEPLREAGRLLRAEVTRQPPGEEPLHALGNAVLIMLRVMAADTTRRHLSILRLISDEPEVRGACLSLSADEQRLLATVLADREGTEPGDLRPAVLAGVFTATAIQATLNWHEQSDGTAQSLEASTEAHLAVLRPAVTGGWGRVASPTRGTHEK